MIGSPELRIIWSVSMEQRQCNLLQQHRQLPNPKSHNNNTKAYAVWQRDTAIETTNTGNHDRRYVDQRGVIEHKLIAPVQRKLPYLGWLLGRCLFAAAD